MRVTAATAAIFAFACGTPDGRDSGTPEAALLRDVVTVEDGETAQVDMTDWPRWRVVGCADQYEDERSGPAEVCGDLSHMFIAYDGMLCGPLPFDANTYVIYGDQPVPLASCTLSPDGYWLEVTRWAE